MGLENAVNLSGGFKGWKEANAPVERSKEKAA
jgi:rhodanese-related sulfurtransferase